MASVAIGIFAAFFVGVILVKPMFGSVSEFRRSFEQFGWSDLWYQHHAEHFRPNPVMIKFMAWIFIVFLTGMISFTSAEIFLDNP